MCNAFNEHFAKISNLNDQGVILPNIGARTDIILTNITISEEEVYHILHNLDINKANGPDAVSPRLLKLCAEAISPPLTTLINFSLTNKVYPRSWKMANVCPRTNMLKQ